MTSNAFGGRWTSDKLDVLRDYLSFYVKALKNQRFLLVYIDAFAGTGRCRITEKGGERVIDGSAKIALDTDGFDEYRFIERKRRHQRELEQLLQLHSNGSRASIAKDDARTMLPAVLDSYDWSRTRGVLFLDPFGLQCTHSMLQQIAATKALDVFFLVSLSGLYRQAALNQAAIDEHKANKLTQFLGTDDWRQMYTPDAQSDFFNAPAVRREPGWQQLLAIMTERLGKVFPYVAQPSVMVSQKGAPLFALYFAVANPSGPAIGLAKRVANDILSKLQG